MSENKGLRHDQGKLRYDLTEPHAIEEIVKIFTAGSMKYAPRNWEKGMSWSKVIACAKRHLAAVEKGIDHDFDPDCEGCKNKNCTNHTGALHAAQAAWNMLALATYFRTYPQGDDRNHSYLNRPKIGLDIDDVLSDFIPYYSKKSGDKIPSNWNFDSNIGEKLKKKDKKFWMDIPAKINSDALLFEPHCYITARSIPVSWTKAWLKKNGFPDAKVYSVGIGKSKVEAAKDSGIDIFVDDNYHNFVELNKNGVCCFLMSAEHNKKYNVGYKRINSLNELIK